MRYKADLALPSKLNKHSKGEAGETFVAGDFGCLAGAQTAHGPSGAMAVHDFCFYESNSNYSKTTPPTL